MAGGIWEGYDRGVAANRAQSLGALQQAQAVQGILAQQQQQELRAQAMQQEQRVRGILSDPNIAPQDKERALMSLGRPGLEALNTMGQINDRNAMAVERTSIARQRDEQAAQLRRNAGREATQQGALERLQGVLSPLPATPEAGGITSQPFVGSPSEADAEAIRRYTVNPNQPMRMNVVDPNEVQRLALAADPKAGVASLLKQAAPGGIKDMATPVAQGYLTRGPDGRPVFNRTYEAPAQRPTFVPGAAQPTLLEGGVARPVVDVAGAPVPAPPRPAEKPAPESPRAKAMFNAGLKDVALAEKALTSANELEGAVKRWQELNAKTSTGPITGRRPISFDDDFQELKKLENYLAVNNFKPGQGQISNYERELIKGSGPTTTNNRQTNENITNITIGGVQNLRDKSQYLEWYLETNGKTLGADAKWQEYLDKNPRYIRDKMGRVVPNDKRVDWQTNFLGGQAPAAPASRAPADILNQADAILNGNR